jgi:hypothetical protein
MLPGKFKLPEFIQNSRCHERKHTTVPEKIAGCDIGFGCFHVGFFNKFFNGKTAFVNRFIALDVPVSRFWIIGLNAEGDQISFLSEKDCLADHFMKPGHITDDMVCRQDKKKSFLKGCLMKNFQDCQENGRCRVAADRLIDNCILS